MSINDLNGSQWLFRSKSVISKSYGQGSFAHKIRRLNKACKPPELCKDIVEIFSHNGDMVFDPFAGTGGIVFGAQMAGRRAMGFEINKGYVEAYKQACLEMGGVFDKYDSDAVKNYSFIGMYDKDGIDTFGVKDTIYQWKLGAESVDMVFTDPPYFDMDSRKKSKRGHSEKGFLERPMQEFGVKFRSLDGWTLFIRDFCEESFRIVKSGKYMVSFMEDMYINGEYVFLTHILSEEAKKAGWVAQGEYIWHNEARRPSFFGYPSKMITSRTHTSILFFKKA